MAEFVGTVSSFLFPVHRRRVMGNLDLAFGDERTKKEKIEIYRNFNINFVKNFFEMAASFNRRNQQPLSNAIRILGQEHLDASLQKGKGAIAIGGHFGNFTIMGFKMKSAGYRFHTVVRAFGDPFREKMYEHYRAKQGQLFIPSRPPKEALKRILQALKKNETVFLITDENKRHGGVFVDFFHRPASTASGPAVLHLRTGADLLPMFLLRNQDNTHQLIIEPPLNIPDTKDRKAEVEEIMQLITKKIEEYVRKYPSQWMWTQRRWRTRPPEEKAKGIEPGYKDY